MDNPSGTLPGIFFPEKFLTTIFSYLSGMGGGIFSPSLSIGAGMGLDMAQLFHVLDLKACALIGMVAFFSGVVQAPLTAVVIIMEMTDHSGLLIPFLVAAFIAHGIGKLIMPVPLYRCLASLDIKSVR
jgi:H+/Cl- antiporter ClcA